MCPLPGWLEPVTGDGSSGCLRNIRKSLTPGWTIKRSLAANRGFDKAMTPDGQMAGKRSDRLDHAIEAARQGRLAVLAGAGISTLPPASLPSWSEFTSALLSVAVATAVNSPFLDEDSIAAIRSLTPDSISTAALSESISKYVASAGYFRFLTVLDSTTTNANHQALAELAGRGRLRAIVTPNFDTLIERAFEESHVPLARPIANVEAKG